MKRAAFARFLALALGMLALLLVLGYWPTRRFGEPAVLAMLAGSAVSLVASLVGAVPVVLTHGVPLPQSMPAVMGSIALRLAVVLALGLAVALSGWLPKAPFLIWLAISHAGLLVADTTFARQATRG